VAADVIATGLPGFAGSGLDPWGRVRILGEKSQARPLEVEGIFQDVPRFRFIGPCGLFCAIVR